MAHRTRKVVMAIGLVAAAVGFGPASSRAQQHAAEPAAPAERVQPQVSYADCKVVRITPRTIREERTALAVAETTWFCERSGIDLDLVVGADGLTALDDAGIPYSVLIADLQSRIDAERAQIDQVRAAEANGLALRGNTYFDTFRTYDEVTARVDLLIVNNPGVVVAQDVGTSRFGRAIRGFSISAPDSVQNPRDQRRQVLVNGTQHAREWLGTTSVMWIAHQLLNDLGTGDPRVSQLLEKLEVIFVPIVNPDGYVYSWTNQRLWRKTRVDNGNGTFGVDPNRNWGYQWGGEGAETEPGGVTYRGPAPFSEPETAALRDFIVARPRINAHVDVHTYGQWILSPWGYTADLPPEPVQSEFTRLNADIAREIRAVHGTTYIGGPAYTVLYPASGTIPDWVHGDRGILSWTLELRDKGSYGFVAPASVIVPTAQEVYAGLSTLFDYVGLPLRFVFPDGLPSVADAGETTSFRVRVDSFGNTVQSGSVHLLSRIGTTGEFTSTELTALPEANEYLATLPAGSCADLIEFSFAAQTTGGVMAQYPLDAQASTLSVPVVQTLLVSRDACEVVGGWTVGAPGDSATTGIWELADPSPTSAQPGDDVSTDGTQCWITGAAAGTMIGSFDVDGGATTLTSAAFPAIDPVGGPAESVILSYWLWYSNDQGSSPAQDPFSVLISNNDGANWQSLQTIPANGSTNAWVQFQFELIGLIEPTAEMKLRFIADDTGSGSVIEAAVDEVTVHIRGCPATPCAADFDGNGTREVPDIFAFLIAWFASDPATDVDGTPGITVPDIFAFLSIWFAGC